MLLAVAVRLVLDTEYSGIIGDNMLAPFLLTLASLYTLGYVSPQGSTVSSLLSAGTHYVQGVSKKRPHILNAHNGTRNKSRVSFKIIKKFSS